MYVKTRSYLHRKMMAEASALTPIYFFTWQYIAWGAISMQPGFFSFRRITVRKSSDPADLTSRDWILAVASGAFPSRYGLSYPTAPACGLSIAICQHHAGYGPSPATGGRTYNLGLLHNASVRNRHQTVKSLNTPTELYLHSEGRVGGPEIRQTDRLYFSEKYQLKKESPIFTTRTFSPAISRKPNGASTGLLCFIYEGIPTSVTTGK